MGEEFYLSFYDGRQRGGRAGLEINVEEGDVCNYMYIIYGSIRVTMRDCIVDVRSEYFGSVNIP